MLDLEHGKFLMLGLAEPVACDDCNIFARILRGEISGRRNFGNQQAEALRVIAP